jgi:hypothetical protein
LNIDFEVYGKEIVGLSMRQSVYDTERQERNDVVGRSRRRKTTLFVAADIDPSEG